MPRPLRPQIAGGVYHITTRGNRGAPIFVRDEDRLLYVGMLRRACERYEWTLHAACLMGNHLHLIVQTAHPNISRGMQWLNGYYAQAFNELHGHSGHVFQGRFHSVLILSDEQLTTAGEYVLANPVRAGLCARPAEWPWTEARSAGLRFGGRSRPRRRHRTRRTSARAP